MELIESPIIYGFVIPFGVYLITEISKKLNLKPEWVAGGLSVILGTLYVIITKNAGEAIVKELFLYTSSIFGIATIIYKFIKSEIKDDLI